MSGRSAKAIGMALTIDQAPDVLKLKEGAQLLRIGKNQMTAAVRAGTIPVVIIGNSKRILKASLVAFLEGRRAEISEEVRA